MNKLLTEKDFPLINNKEKKYKYVILTLIAILLELLFVIGETNGIFVVSGVGALLLLISASFLNVKNTIFLLLFLLPNQRYIVFPDNDTTLLNIIVIIMLIKLISIKTKIFIPILLFMFLLTIYSLNLIYRFDSTSEFLIIIKMCITIIVLLWAYSRYQKDSDFFITSIKFLSLGCISASLIALFISNEVFIGTNIRFSGGENNNANIFSALLSYAIASIFIIILTVQKQSKLLLALLPMLVLVGLLTQSRSFILAILFVIIYVTLFGMVLNKKTLGIVITMIITILFAINFALKNPISFIGKLLSSVTNRISDPKNGDLSNGRFQLWKDYLQFFKENNEYLFLGIGNNWGIFGFENVAHNGIIELIAFGGLIGTILILLILYLSICELKKEYFKNNGFSSQRKLLYYLPLWILIITNVTGHNFFNLSFVTLLFLSFVGIYSKENIYSKKSDSQS